MPKLRLWATATVLAALAASGCGETTVKQATSSTEPTPAANTEGATPVVDRQVGDSVTLKGNTEGTVVEVTLLAVKPRVKSSDGFLEPDAGNRYAAVQIRLRNVGTAVYADSPSNGVGVVDGDDQAFKAAVFEIKKPGLGTVTIKPGDRRVGWLSFEVPEGADLRTLQVALDSGFGPETGEWSIR